MSVERATCRQCGRPIVKYTDRWVHVNDTRCKALRWVR